MHVIEEGNEAMRREIGMASAIKLLPRTHVILITRRNNGAVPMPISSTIE